MFSRYLFGFVVMGSFAGFCLHAQNPGKAPPVKKLTAQQEIVRLMRIDPRSPEISSGDVQQKLQSMKNNFVSREFPRNLREYRNGSNNTASVLRVVAVFYKRTISHPDLEEATGNTLDWYNRVGAAFVDLYAPLNSIERAFVTSDAKLYASSVASYQARAKNLEKVLNKPEKLSARELDKLKEQNTLRRKKEIQKKISDLNRQRRTVR